MPRLLLSIFFAFFPLSRVEFRVEMKTTTKKTKNGHEEPIVGGAKNLLVKSEIRSSTTVYVPREDEALSRSLSAVSQQHNTTQLNHPHPCSRCPRYKYSLHPILRSLGSSWRQLSGWLTSFKHSKRTPSKFFASPVI